MLDLLVTKGQVATGADLYEGSIGIKDGKIVLISQTDIEQDALRTIDTSGKIIIPGVIDPHMHCRTATTEMIEGPEEISVTAAYGGVTTVLRYIAAVRVTDKEIEGMKTYRVIEAASIRVKDYFEKMIEEGERSSVVDFGIHWIFAKEESLIPQIPDAMKMGISSLKMILGYHPLRGMLLDDRQTYWIMEEVAKLGGMVNVHAENGWIVGYLEDKYVAEGRYTAENYLEARGNPIEAEAAARLIAIASMTGCPLYIVHNTTRESVDLIAKAKSEGKHVIAETCPQYLLLIHQVDARQGALNKVAPPIRTADDNEALWQGISRGIIDTVGSDHAPYDRDSQKLAAADFRDVPFGIPSIETMLPLMYSEGVVKGRITLNRMVQVLCENSAKVFGLYPRKGSISIGADADLVIIDPTIEWQIKAEQLHSKAGYTPFEGWQVKGKPIMSLLRGEVLLEGGQLHQKPGFGSYLPRPTSSSKEVA